MKISSLIKTLEKLPADYDFTLGKVVAIDVDTRRRSIVVLSGPIIGLTVDEENGEVLAVIDPGPHLDKLGDVIPLDDQPEAGVSITCEECGNSIPASFGKTPNEHHGDNCSLNGANIVH